MNKIKTRKYFYITEDPPLPLKLQNKSTITNINLPKLNKYFFIDFSDDCTIRLMNKIEPKQQSATIPVLKIEKYGRNIITNLEDSSPRSQKLVKYQQQQIQFMQRKRNIRLKLKQTLDQTKSTRKHSSLTVKHHLMDYYSSSPYTIDYHRSDTNESTIIDERLHSKQSQVLKRLGLGNNLADNR